MSSTSLQAEQGQAPKAPAYDPAAVEARWQEAWARARSFATPPEDERTSSYVFAGCPFTSGDAHLGHIRSYTISDAFARFRRAQGDAVLFSLGFDSFGLPAELEAIKRGVSPRAWVERCRDRMRGQFERLGYSCDWDRTFDSSEPGHYRWTQWLFLAMLEKGLVYRRDAQVTWCDSCRTVLASLQAEDGECWRCHGAVRFVRRPQWFMKISAYLEDNEKGLDDLPGWTKAAVGGQRAVLGRIDGVEVDALVLGGGELTVFTPHPNSIRDAAFVAVSPTHPEVDAFTSKPEVAKQLERVREAGWRRDDRGAERAQVVQTGMQASVPGASTLLPIVISPLVDGRYGSTAVLGIPGCDETDRGIAERLEKPAASAFKLTRTTAKPRPAARYKARDFPISRQRAWGAPIPLVHCNACGTVPVPPEQLPVRLPDDLEVTGEGNPLAERADFLDCECPRCGAAAKRESDTIDCHVDGMWMWMPIVVPAEDRETSMFSHAEYQRWLPARQIVWGADAGGYMFDQRLIGKVLQDLGELPPLEAREPFANALMHQMVRMDGRKMSKHLGNVVDPNELVEQVGADVVRLAVLNAAAPGRAFNWNEQPVRHCQRFLAELWDYAEPRLREWERPANGEIDASTRLRRRLGTWSRIGLEKIAENLERLEMQRATHNAMLLLERVQDFERRAGGEDGELDTLDREAVVATLLLLVQGLAPFVPHVAEELWAAAGNETLLSETPWPRP
jgi:leucyl-tRNA synthetase